MRPVLASSLFAGHTSHSVPQALCMCCRLRQLLPAEFLLQLSTQKFKFRGAEACKRSEPDSADDEWASEISGESFRTVHSDWSVGGGLSQKRLGEGNRAGGKGGTETVTECPQGVGQEEAWPWPRTHRPLTRPALGFAVRWGRPDRRRGWGWPWGRLLAPSLGVPKGPFPVTLTLRLRIPSVCGPGPLGSAQGRVGAPGARSGEVLLAGGLFLPGPSPPPPAGS